MRITAKMFTLGCVFVALAVGIQQVKSEGNSGNKQ